MRVFDQGKKKKGTLNKYFLDGLGPYLGTTAVLEEFTVFALGCERL